MITAFQTCLYIENIPKSLSNCHHERSTIIRMRDNCAFNIYVCLSWVRHGTDLAVQCSRDENVAYPFRSYGYSTVAVYSYCESVVRHRVPLKSLSHARASGGSPPSSHAGVQESAYGVLHDGRSDICRAGDRHDFRFANNQLSGALLRNTWERR